MPAISRRAAASDQPLAGATQERAQVAVLRVFERQAVEHAAPSARDQRKRVEDADRARMAVEQLAEVGLAQPAVDARADLDADRLRHHRSTRPSRVAR